MRNLLVFGMSGSAFMVCLCPFKVASKFMNTLKQNLVDRIFLNIILHFLDVLINWVYF